MLLRLNWKNFSRGFYLLFSLLLLGCSVQSVSVRPSYNKDYENKLGKGASGNTRASFRGKERADDGDVLLEDGESDFEVVPRKRGSSESGIRKAAERYLGSPYLYGGTTARGFDCSGFVWRVFQDAGYTSFPRETAQRMFDRGTFVSGNNLREGDLCFFHSPKNKRKIDHVGIYLGDDLFIHSGSSVGVGYSNISDVYWKKYFVGYKRLLP